MCWNPIIKLPMPAFTASKKVEKCIIIQLMAISIYCPIFIINLLRFELFRLFLLYLSPLLR